MHTIYSYRTSQLSQQSGFLYFISNFSTQEHLISQPTYRGRQKCHRPRSVKVFTDSNRYCNSVTITQAIYSPCEGRQEIYHIFRYLIQYLRLPCISYLNFKNNWSLLTCTLSGSNLCCYLN